MNVRSMSDHFTSLPDIDMWVRKKTLSRDRSLFSICTATDLPKKLLRFVYSTFNPESRDVKKIIGLIFVSHIDMNIPAYTLICIYLLTPSHVM